MVEALPKIITIRQYEHALACIPLVFKKKDVTYWRTLLQCPYYTGLRSIEVCELKVWHINFNEKYLVIPKQKNLNDHERIIVPDEYLQILHDHCQKYRPQIKKAGGYVFFSKKSSQGKNIARETIRWFIRELRRVSGLTTIYGYKKDKTPKFVFSFHTLRHVFIQQLTDRNINQHVIMQCSRHKSMESLRRYQHSSLELKRMAIDLVFNAKETEEQKLARLKEDIQEIKGILNNRFVVGAY